MVDESKADPFNLKKPEPAPSSVEPDEEESEPKSTLAPDVAEREAQKAIREIEEEVEEEHPSAPMVTPPVRHHAGEKTFLDKAWERQYTIEARLKRIGHGRYARVIKMARKPEDEEYNKALQITGIGILAVGFVGFVIYLLMQWIHSLLQIK